MRLESYLHKQLVIADMTASTKEEVLADLAQAVVRVYPQLDAATITSVLCDRERLGSTGIGDGIGIPHGKLTGIDDIVIVVARSERGVDFEALDGQPVHAIFLVLAPAHVVGVHLRVLAHISRLLKDAAFRSAFMCASDEEALWQLLASA